jgi:hypothetical protein
MKYLIGIYDYLNESKIEDIYSKYYSDIEYSIFNKLVGVDPTTVTKNGNITKMGSYSKWILSLYKDNRLKREDFYKAAEYLTSFDTLKQTGKITGQDGDILRYKSLPDLLKLINHVGGTGKPAKDEKYLIQDRYYINNGEAEVFYESDTYLIVIPKTLDASKFYAYGTEWCTQYPDMFDKYSRQGRLYIIVDKLNLNASHYEHRRLQFHFESSQFMDINDEALWYDVLQYFKYIFANVKKAFLLNYDSVSEFIDNRAVVERNKMCGYIDGDGNEITPLIYNVALNHRHGRAVVQLNNKYGALDKDGNMVIPFLYDSIMPFSFNKLSIAKIGNACGVIDRDGNEVVPFIYRSLSDIMEIEDKLAHSEYVGMIASKKETRKHDMYGKFGIIDDKGNVRVPFIYDALRVDYHETLLCAKKNNKWGFVTYSDGRELTEFKYETLVKYANGKFAAKYTDDFGHEIEVTISRTGKEIKIKLIHEKNLHI